MTKDYDSILDKWVVENATREFDVDTITCDDSLKHGCTDPAGWQSECIHCGNFIFWCPLDRATVLTKHPRWKCGACGHSDDPDMLLNFMRIESPT